MSLVRGTSLLGFTELVIELGADPTVLLRRAHLDPGSVGGHDTFVGYRSVLALLEDAAGATGQGDFGRLLATRQGLEILGPIGVAARTAPTVGAALAAIEQYMAYYSPALAVGVVRGPGPTTAGFEWRILAERPPVHRQAAELALGVAVRVFRLLAGEDFLPSSVQLRHQALGDRNAYVRYFGCPVEFTSARYGFRFPAAVLARTIEADGAVHAVVRDYLSSVVGPSAPTVSDAVGQLVRRMLPTGALDLVLVADQLGHHPRTVQRQLAAQGTSFAGIVDVIRREEAERYLRDSDMPLGQLSGVLGFSEQSAFSRACRRWFGASPTQVRRSAGQGAQPVRWGATVS
jgi:AraC-like DNA-binding protein